MAHDGRAEMSDILVVGGGLTGSAIGFGAAWGRA